MNVLLEVVKTSLATYGTYKSSRDSLIVQIEQLMIKFSVSICIGSTMASSAIWD